MLRIRASDLSNGVYSGARVDQDDLVEIPDYFGEIIFPSGLVCRELRIGREARVMVRGDSRMKVMYSEGTAAFLGNVWLGSVKSAGDVIVDGNLSVWLGDILVMAGDICVSGTLRAEGSITAHAGGVIVSGRIISPDPVISEVTWEGASGKPFPKRAHRIAQNADQIISFIEGRQGAA